jgi:hypothetical protein
VALHASQKAQPEIAGLDGADARLSRLYWRAVDPVSSALELGKCWLVDRLYVPFPETPIDRSIQERGDQRFTARRGQKRAGSSRGAPASLVSDGLDLSQRSETEAGR